MDFEWSVELFYARQPGARENAEELLFQKVRGSFLVTH